MFKICCCLSPSLNILAGAIFFIAAVWISGLLEPIAWKMNLRLIPPQDVVTAVCDDVTTLVRKGGLCPKEAKHGDIWRESVSGVTCPANPVEGSDPEVCAQLAILRMLKPRACCENPGYYGRQTRDGGYVMCAELLRRDTHHKAS